MKIKNNKVIYKLSKKMLKSENKRNRIAIMAIVLTTLLFTSIFTIIFSLNETYQTYTFRQIGGYSHGSFKKINKEQKNILTQNHRIKKYGIRSFLGSIQDGKFSKKPAEIHYMDHNVAKWGYIKLVEGRLPEKENEVAMDISALKKLGVQAKVGEKIKLKFHVDENGQIGERKSEEFILSGYWEEDDLLKVHLIAISEKYLKHIEEQQVSKGLAPFTMEMEVMLNSSFDITEQMNRILMEQGFESGEISIGINWGYTTAQFSNILDEGIVIFIVFLLVIVILVGYLIINNVFQISVSSDIRLYGLLKTIGVTPKQLRKIVIKQAIILCMFGIPIGIVLGYMLGNIVTPFIIKKMNSDIGYLEMSYSYFIFVLSVIFSMSTVFIACIKPAKYASKISPIDATKYVDYDVKKKSYRKTKSAKILSMSIANISRNKKKTTLVIASITLSFVMLNVLGTFVGGFDMDKYLEKTLSADFIISNPEYFQYKGGNIPEKDIEFIKANINATKYGAAYISNSCYDRIWITEEQWNDYSKDWKEDKKEGAITFQDKNNGYVTCGINIEAMDEGIFHKLNVVKGEFDYKDMDGIALVLSQDDFGNISVPDGYPKIGEKIKIDYIGKVRAIDTRTGKDADDNIPKNYLKYEIEKGNSVEYIVKAYVTVPYSLGLRYFDERLQAILPFSTLSRDNSFGARAVFYAFDTDNMQDEKMAEKFLNKLSKQKEHIMYESKETVRTEFNNFKTMFTVIGGLLCLIIGLVGMLNYTNMLMTSFFLRKREFALIQAIGMTGKQLKKMLIYEGSFYIFVSFAVSIVLSSIIFYPLNRLLEKMFWFYQGHFTLMPIVLLIPILIIIGFCVPYFMFKKIKNDSIIDRIRE